MLCVLVLGGYVVCISGLCCVVCINRSNSSIIICCSWSDGRCSHSDMHVCVCVCVCRGFGNIQKEIQDMAETSLVHLHLEVRCHCFYFLLPVLHKVSRKHMCLIHMHVKTRVPSILTVHTCEDTCTLHPYSAHM